MNVEKTIQLSSYARAIDYKNNLILVGTRDGTILRIEGQSQQVVINSHSTGETWGLAIDN